MSINLDGPFICCKAIVPTMLEQKYGRIVNIASIAGKEGNPNAAHYSASKAGLIALTKSLGKELAQHDILVNAVTPAAAKTAIFDQLTQQHIDFMLSKIPKGRFVLVEELAAMVAWLASEDCAFSTGAVFDISGGRATYQFQARSISRHPEERGTRVSKGDGPQWGRSSFEARSARASSDNGEARCAGMTGW